MYSTTASAYSPTREKSLSTATERLPRIRHHKRHLLIPAIPINPHAREPPIDRNLIQQQVFSHSLAAITSTAAPLPAARSVADKVDPDARDVRHQTRTLCERRRKGDPVVAGADGDWPAKAAREREVDVSVVGAQRHVEEWKYTVASVLGGQTVVLLWENPIVLTL